MLSSLPMEGAGNGGSELPAGSSDIVGQLVLAVRKMTEEMVPKMDLILKHVEEFKSARTSIEQEWKLREARIDQLENRLNPFVETWISTENKRMLEDPISTMETKNMELRFSNKISQPILTGDDIKAEDNTCIEVSLLDSSTGNIVEVGSVASASVEIVVLGQGTDDWTGEEFNEKIVRVEGKPPLLTVNECKLQRGEGVLKKVKFRYYAAELVKPSEFRLGARIAEKFDGITVKEATTESFVVQSYRKKYSQKNEIPCLEDNIWVLKNIQRRGNIDKRLQAKGINTVEKFLIQLLINPEELKTIFGLGGEKWKATVNHARKCKSNRMYCYTSSQETLCVVFDIFGRLQGLHSEGYYMDTNTLSKNKKACMILLLLTQGKPARAMFINKIQTKNRFSIYRANHDKLLWQVDADKLLLSAFEHWEDVTVYVDLESLQQHHAAMKTSFNPSNPCVPGQYSGTKTDAGASEMVDESDNMDGIPSSDTDSLARCDSAESEAVVPGSESPRKWKMVFFCISRLFLIRKLLNSEANHVRKKQKICSRNTGHPMSNPNVEAYDQMVDGSNNFEFPSPSLYQESLSSDTTSLAHFVGSIDDMIDIPSLLARCSSFDFGSPFDDFDNV